MNILKGISTEWVHLTAAHLTGEGRRSGGKALPLADEHTALTLLIDAGIRLERAFTGYSQAVLGDRSGLHSWPVFDGVVVRAIDAPKARAIIQNLHTSLRKQATQTEEEYDERRATARRWQPELELVF